MISRVLLILLALAVVGPSLPGCDSGTGGVKEAPVAHDAYVGGHGTSGGAAGSSAPAPKKGARSR